MPFNSQNEKVCWCDNKNLATLHLNFNDFDKL